MFPTSSLFVPCKSIQDPHVCATVSTISALVTCVERVDLVGNLIRDRWWLSPKFDSQNFQQSLLVIFLMHSAFGKYNLSGPSAIGTFLALIWSRVRYHSEDLNEGFFWPVRRARRLIVYFGPFLDLNTNGCYASNHLAPLSYDSGEPWPPHFCSIQYCTKDTSLHYFVLYIGYE